MADRLLDTDVLIDHLRGFRRLPDSEGRSFISTITRAELFAGPIDQLPEVRSLLAVVIELDVDSAIAERAGAVRREAGILMPDAIIAATALERGLPLLSRNRRDFELVAGLELLAAD